MNEDKKKELTPEQRHAQELEAWAKTCEDIMAISEKTGCPPEAVATIVLLYGLNAQTHIESGGLRMTLVKLFSKKIEIDPRKLGIVKN
jgi:hypothetical protein